MNVSIDKDKAIIAIVIFLLVSIVGGYGYLQSRMNDDLQLITEEKPEEHTNAEDQIDNYIYVHVSGHVHSTGVYKLPQGSRVLHAIELAGGSTEEGDVDKLNLAQTLQDGQKIIVPSVHDEVVTEIQDGLQNSNQGMININTATQQQLESLAGIGPAKASAIIQYRQQHGPFNKIDDIQKVSGIGTATYTQIKDSITVN